MNAEFFSVQPRLPAAARTARPLVVEPRLRQVHRWTSMVFTLTVASNFAAMAWGPPPAVVTYAPLPPLLLLTLTGLYMMARRLRPARSAGRPLSRRT